AARQFPHVRDRFAFADRLRRAWVEDAPAKIRSADLAAVLPPSALTAPLESPATNPLSARRRDAAQRLWAWHTSRFEYEARDPLDPSPAVNGVPFALAAAKSCAAAAGAGGFPFVEVSPAATPRLTFEKPRAELKLNIREVGAPPTCAEVRALTPADDWLKPVPAASAKLDPVRERAVALALAAGDKPTSHPTSLGVLVEVAVQLDDERRTFHRRVPVSLRTLSDRVDLLVRTDPKAAPHPLNEFRVRPNGRPAPYQLVLFNPTPLPQKVIARLAGLNRETAPLTLVPDKPVPLVFASTAPPPAPLPPPAPGTAPPVDDGFRPLSGNTLTLELIDPADKEAVLQTFAIPVAVADPASYLRVADAVFRPAGDGKPNRLSATVVPGDIPGTGDCPVKMVLPPEMNGGLVVRDGNQAGAVAAGGKPVTLYAENVAFPSPAGAVVTATVSADGVERVFTYTAALPTLGETVRLRPVADPCVRVKAVKFAEGTKPLPVTLEVDNAPEGARLELVVGTEKGAKEPIAADRTLSIATARAKEVRYRFDSKGESLELAGSIADHKPVLSVDLLTGRRAIQARLLAPSGAELAKSCRAYVVFDGSAPKVEFDPPPRAAKGQPLAVKATAGPTVSGIDKVRFFIGKPEKGELPANPVPVKGVRVEGGEWRAALQMPDTKGVVVVGVQFTTQAGRATVETREIELLDAAELNKPAPGAIAGKLVENRIAQPGATVFLYDAKGNAIAKAATKTDGAFEFKDLPPGAYYLFSEKVSTRRNVKESVEVKAGETTTKELELLIP
ncbi:MAG: carboxypeptidase regulatory-like domain-containing protein, partial [Planctomycetes bacterium]|nr:carboxypeptidase regulatory-like domain-containing protein [Planctomycetota bacterium]